MALTAGFIEGHIANWEGELTKPWYAYRANWPSRLFHHAPIENAVLLLKDGNLRSRKDDKNARASDVAAAAVLASREDAHDFARLYFRPLTPTQWHIEGIRKSTECSYGEASHAPILIMFVFSARSVLQSPGVKFSDRNMQISGVQPSDTETYFSNIPFDKVFHVGSSDKTIRDHRCAEVLATSPLPLANALQWIYCRSIAERETLCDMLGTDGPKWVSKIIVSDDLKVFERRYTFVEHVSIVDDGIVFQLNPRYDSMPISVKMIVTDLAGNEVATFGNSEMQARPPAPSTRWRVKKSLPHGTYRVRIDLEGCLAYSASVKHGDELV